MEATTSTRFLRVGAVLLLGVALLLLALAGGALTTAQRRAAIAASRAGGLGVPAAPQNVSPTPAALQPAAPAATLPITLAIVGSDAQVAAFRQTLADTNTMLAGSGMADPQLIFVVVPPGQPVPTLSTGQPDGLTLVELRLPPGH